MRLSRNDGLPRTSRSVPGTPGSARLTAPEARRAGRPGVQEPRALGSPCRIRGEPALATGEDQERHLLLPHLRHHHRHHHGRQASRPCIAPSATHSLRIRCVQPARAPSPDAGCRSGAGHAGHGRADRRSPSRSACEAASTAVSRAPVRSRHELTDRLGMRSALHHRSEDPHALPAKHECFSRCLRSAAKPINANIDQQERPVCKLMEIYHLVGSP